MKGGGEGGEGVGDFWLFYDKIYLIPLIGCYLAVNFL